MSTDSRGSSAEVEYFPFPTNTGLPFSEAVRVGNLLFVSGQMGILPGGRQVVSGGIGPETKQALANAREILERHGSSLNRVVKCTVMMADMSEWPAMNAVYVEHFPENLPARSAFGCSALALGGRVEIECIATVDI